MPLKATKTARSKLEPKMMDGIFLGMGLRTDEVRIGTTKGVVKARTIKRLCEEDRWKAEALEQMCGEPTQPVPGVRGDHIPIQIHGDGEAAKKGDEDKEDEDDDKDADVPKEVNIPRPPEDNVRKMRVRKIDIEKYGPTQGCPGCRKLNTPGAGGHVTHNEECRRRIKEELSNDEQGRERLEHDAKRQERKQDAIIER